MEHLPRVLSNDGAARLGFTPARIRTELRRQRWHRLATGVLLTRPDEPTREDWIQVGMILGGSRAALTGWDVLRFRGLGPPRPPVPHVLVLTPAGRNRRVGGLRLRPSRRPLRSARTAAWDERLPGVRLATTARAITDAAPYYRQLAPIRAMVTQAVQRGLCSPAELATECAAAPRNGTGRLRIALRDVLDDARSVAEAEAVDQLRAIGLTGFLVNAPIRDADGRLAYVADLLWPDLWAIAEIDSREFHFGEDEWHATMARHNALTAMGYAVTHYPPSAVRAGGVGWAHEIAAWLTERAAALGRPAPRTDRRGGRTARAEWRA